MKQTTYIMIKPHFANYKEIIELVKSRITEKGYKIIDQSFVKYNCKDAQNHYAEHFRGSYENAKGFYKELEDYIISDKAYGLIVNGEYAITFMRALIKELRQTIPAMLGEEPRLTENVLHGSDSVESAIKEIEIFKSLKEKYNQIEIEM